MSKVLLSTALLLFLSENADDSWCFDLPTRWWFELRVPPNVDPPSREKTDQETDEREAFYVPIRSADDRLHALLVLGPELANGARVGTLVGTYEGLTWTPKATWVLTQREPWIVELQVDVSRGSLDVLLTLLPALFDSDPSDDVGGGYAFYGSPPHSGVLTY